MQSRGHMRANAIVAGLLVLCVSTVLFAEGPEDSTSPEKERCPVCKMFVSMFEEWNSRIEFKDRAATVFDGSKCMFKYYLNMQKYDSSRKRSDVSSISVRDYYSKTYVDARQAFFVIWSDIYGPMGHEPIPFEREVDAKSFLKEHKGKRILRFQDINTRVITALDNP